MDSHGRDEALDRGYEGYVAKDEAIVYEQGPTRPWLKVKVPGWTVEGDGWQPRVSVAPSALRLPSRTRSPSL